MNSRVCSKQSLDMDKNELLTDTLYNRSKLAAETTTTILSTNSHFFENHLSNSNEYPYIPPAPPLPNQTVRNPNKIPLKSFDLTSSQSEIKDPSIVITKSFLINSNAEDNLEARLHHEKVDDQNEFRKNAQTLNVKNQSFENFEAKQSDENDNVNELISISQIPSVIQTLDRQKSESYAAQSKSVIPFNDPRRMTSFRSDFSTNSIGSNVSTRSMLTEAKAKLEALSGKMNSTKQTSNPSRSYTKANGYLNINANNNDNNQNDISDEGDISDYLQTKF